MLISNKTVADFSRKIYGFAYDKTRDHYKAEDLAQDIILNLLKSSSDISNIDGYVYTVCCYTWANFLRKSSKSRNNVCIDDMCLPDDSSVENDAERKMLIEKMQREISRLSKTHRDITVMFYYDDMSCDEISRVMNIKSSTVRWYLGESRRKLREGIEMSENLSYVPIRMGCGHDGWSNDMSMHGLSNNILVQNIAYACYGELVTVEEISRKLNVAAAYLEFYIDDLVYMDYLKKIGNKYQTNFYIKDKAAQLAENKYNYENIGSIAEKILGEVRSRLDDIIGIGFMGCGLDREYLLWGFFADCVNDIFVKGRYVEYPKVNPGYKNIETPLRKDGTRHWICAGLRYDTDISEGEQRKFADYFGGNGIKTREAGGEFDDFANAACGNGCGKTRNLQTVFSIQFDYWQNAKWREFNGEELLMLARIREIILSGEETNSHDKVIISKMAGEGYVKVENGVPAILVPFMTAEERKSYERIREEIRLAVGVKPITDYFDGFGKIMDRLIPRFLHDNIRQHHKYSCQGTWAALGWARLKNLIGVPDEQQQKAIMTMLWFN